MEIQLAVIVVGTIGLAASFAGSLGAGLKFLLFYVVLVAVLGWVLSAMARRQHRVLVGASPQTVTAAVQNTFSGVGWKHVEGPGTLNFRARGLGFGSFKATRPVLSVQIDPEADGSTAVGIWTSSWGSRMGWMALCDRVVSKRFWRERKLGEMSASSIGSGDSSASAGAGGPRAAGGGLARTAPSAASSGQRKAAANGPKVTLADPGLADNDLKQLGYQLFTACGVSYLTWSGLPLEQHLQTVLRQLPAVGNASVNPLGGGMHGSHDDPDGMWMAYESPHGSMLAYHVMHSTDAALHDVAMRLPLIEDPVNWGIATVGATVPAEPAHIFAAARAVPLWELSAFTGHQPPPDLTVPPELAADLVNNGWDNIGGGGFKLDVPLHRGGSQAVFFSPYDAQTFAVIAPLESSVGGAIPEALRSRTYGHYRLEVIGDMIVLCEHLPAGPPAPDAGAVTAAGRAITLYAEREFAGPAPAPPGFGVLSGSPAPSPMPPPAPGPPRREDQISAATPIGATSGGGFTRRRWAILAAAGGAVAIAFLASTAIGRGPGNAVGGLSPSTVTVTSTFITATSTVSGAAPTAPSAPGVVDADAHGFFTFGNGARCFNTDQAVMFMRTDKSALVVCRSEVSRLYYRGYRISDGASIDLYEVYPQSGGYVAVNASDNARYVIGSSGFRLEQNGTVVSTEPAVEVGP